MIDVEKFITNLRVHLIRSLPFYGHVLMQLPVVYDDEFIPTMGVGKTNKDEIMVKLYVNKKYIESVVEFCKKDETKIVDHFTEVLKHEIHHLIFSHLTLDFPDKQRQTIACELSVNSFVNRKKLVSLDPNEKPGVFPEDYNLPDKLSVKEYYDRLNGKVQKNNNKVIIIMKNGDSDGDGDGSGKGDNGTLDSHEKWKIISGDDMTNEMVKDIIRQANETCKQTNNWGDVPAEIKKQIDNCYASNKKIIPWEVVLRNFLASSAENVLNYTMRRRSKRYGTRPGTKKDDLLTVAIGIDCSGSISMDMLKLFFNELYWIEKTGVKITVFEWDTEIHREYDFKEFDGTVEGGGGTDPTDFLEEVSKRKFDCIITFTDFYFSEIKKRYNIPMMWVVDGYYENHYPVKEGLIMKVNETKDGFELVK